MMVWLLPPPLGAGRVHEEHWGGLAPTGLLQPLVLPALRPGRVTAELGVSHALSLNFIISSEMLI